MTRASPGWAALLATLLLTSIAVPGARADAPGTPALRRERLSWVSQNFIRAETLSAASAILVAARIPRITIAMPVTRNPRQCAWMPVHTSWREMPGFKRVGCAPGVIRGRCR